MAMDWRGLLGRVKGAKWKLHLGRKPDAPQDPKADLAPLQNAVMLGSSMDELIRTPGWKAMSQLITLKQQIVFDAWTKADPADVQAMSKLQQEVKTLAYVVELPIKMSEEGKEAQAKLKEYENAGTSGERRAS
jgi:hypothetical protein